MKQTAVEWLINELNELSSMGLSIGQYSSVRKNIIEQAKAMEKEQMCKFAYKCHRHYKVNGDFKIEQYYNETFKSE